MVISSDDEQALVKPLDIYFFPETKQVLCTRHFRQNAKQKLIDDAITLNDKNAILNKSLATGELLKLRVVFVLKKCATN